MNVALPALIAFALLLPGFVFRWRLRRVERTSLDYTPFGQVVIEAVAWAAGLHLLWLAAAYGLLGQQFRADVLLGLMGSDTRAQTEAVRHVSQTSGWVALYFASLFIAAFAAASAARWIVTALALDRSDRWFAPFFRYPGAPWYYMLTAADRPENAKPDLIYVSAVVELGKEAFLYTGILEDFHVDDTGQLDRLILSNAARRQLSADKQSPEDSRDARFYAIDGDLFVLRYSEAITLNIQYVRLQEIEALASSPSNAPPTPELGSS